MKWTFALLAAVAFAQDAGHLANLRRITSGGQNAEAYWSPDGKRLVFQSTRDAKGVEPLFPL